MNEKTRSEGNYSPLNLDFNDNLKSDMQATIPESTKYNV